MSIRIRRRPSIWSISLLLAAGIVAGFLVLSANKPLPMYLVANRDLLPGQTLISSDFDQLNLDLGPLATRYLSAIDSQSAVVSQIPAGELVPLSRVGRKLLPNQTSIRIIPSTKPAANVVPGSFVSIWKVTEVDENYQAELLVVRAEVSAIIEAEGLIAQDVPEVEVLLGTEQATLLMTALSAKQDVFVLPIS